MVHENSSVSFCFTFGFVAYEKSKVIGSNRIPRAKSRGTGQPDHIHATLGVPRCNPF